MKDQVALITGGSRGVGLGIAQALADAGTAVCVVSRTADQVEEAAAGLRSSGATALPLVADVTNRGAVATVVDTVERELGPITLLVNNAGTLAALGPFVETDPDVWWHDVETHVRGAILCTRAVLPQMVARGAGRIVNVVGMLGQDGSPYTSGHASAKAALFRLTDCLASELRGTGVSVFAVSPGPVRTEITTRLAESADGRRWLPEFADLPDDEWLPASRGGELVVRLARGDGDVLSGRYLHVYQELDELVANADAIVADDRLALRVVR